MAVGNDVAPDPHQPHPQPLVPYVAPDQQDPVAPDQPPIVPDVQPPIVPDAQPDAQIDVIIQPPVGMYMLVS